MAVSNECIFIGPSAMQLTLQNVSVYVLCPAMHASRVVPFVAVPSLAVKALSLGACSTPPSGE